MRSLVMYAVVALTACSSGKVIDAGSNGSSSSSGAGTACPAGDICTPAQTPGVTTIATQIQETPTNMVSDGTFLYWVSGQGPGGPVARMPVGGGAITDIVPAPVPGGLIALDATNVYFPGQAGGLDSAPKAGGASPAPVSEIPSTATAIIVAGTQAYWLQSQGATLGNPICATSPGDPGCPQTVTVESVPLRGGPVSVVSTLPGVEMGLSQQLAVTASTVFMSSPSGSLMFFPIATGVPDGGMLATVSGLPNFGCSSFLVSDTARVYCGTSGSVVAIASDGTTTTLGPLLGASAGNGDLAFDDTTVYWVDGTMVGTIMKAPTNGGTATVVARDTSPVAIAVDAHAIYWSDSGGDIMRIAK